jgi:hypothetical protein
MATLTPKEAAGNRIHKDWRAGFRPGSNQQPGFGGLSRPWNGAGRSSVGFVADQELETLIEVPRRRPFSVGRPPQKAKGP